MLVPNNVFVCLEVFFGITREWADLVGAIAGLARLGQVYLMDCLVKLFPSLFY